MSDRREFLGKVLALAAGTVVLSAKGNPVTNLLMPESYPEHLRRYYYFSTLYRELRSGNRFPQWEQAVFLAINGENESKIESHLSAEAKSQLKPQRLSQALQAAPEVPREQYSWADSEQVFPWDERNGKPAQNLRADFLLNAFYGSTAVERAWLIYYLAACNDYRLEPIESTEQLVPAGAFVFDAESLPENDRAWLQAVSEENFAAKEVPEWWRRFSDSQALHTKNYLRAASEEERKEALDDILGWKLDLTAFRALLAENRSAEPKVAAWAKLEITAQDLEIIVSRYVRGTACIAELVWAAERFLSSGWQEVATDYPIWGQLREKVLPAIQSTIQREQENLRSTTGVSAKVRDELYANLLSWQPESFQANPLRNATIISVLKHARFGSVKHLESIEQEFTTRRSLVVSPRQQKRKTKVWLHQLNEWVGFGLAEAKRVEHTGFDPKADLSYLEAKLNENFRAERLMGVFHRIAATQKVAEFEEETEAVVNFRMWARTVDVFLFAASARTGSWPADKVADSAQELLAAGKRAQRLLRALSDPERITRQHAFAAEGVNQLFERLRELNIRNAEEVQRMSESESILLAQHDYAQAMIPMIVMAELNRISTSPDLCADQYFVDFKMNLYGLNEVSRQLVHWYESEQEFALEELPERLMQGITSELQNRLSNLAPLPKEGSGLSMLDLPVERLEAFMKTHKINHEAR